LGEVKLLFLKWPLLARQTCIADAVTFPIGGSQVPINAAVSMGRRVYRDLGFRLLFTVSDQRLPAVTGYIKLRGL
jgi:hypothetical protein